MGSGYATLSERLKVALAPESLVTIERLTDASLTNQAVFRRLAGAFP
jgi:hypothetical protein